MAIAFDAFSSAATAANGTSLTFSHTCAGGTDNVLVAGGITRSGSNPTGVTYNGTAMTFLQAAGIAGFTGVTQWYLPNPASGAHNIVVSIASSTCISFGGISLTGAATSPIGNFNAATGTGGANPNITVNSGNWGISQTGDNNSTPDGGSPGSPQTLRYNRYTTGGTNGHTGGATNDTDSTTSWGSSFGSYAVAGVEILAPVSGPANVKTWDGLAIASVKTFNGLAKTSTKSVNGVT